MVKQQKVQKSLDERAAEAVKRANAKGKAKRERISSLPTHGFLTTDQPQSPPGPHSPAGSGHKAAIAVRRGHGTELQYADASAAQIGSPTRDPIKTFTAEATKVKAVSELHVRAKTGLKADNVALRLEVARLKGQVRRKISPTSSRKTYPIQLPLPPTTHPTQTQTYPQSPPPIRQQVKKLETQLASAAANGFVTAAEKKSPARETNSWSSS